jgi:hypothetical protein
MRRKGKKIETGERMRGKTRKGEGKRGTWERRKEEVTKKGKREKVEDIGLKRQKGLEFPWRCGK